MSRLTQSEQWILGVLALILSVGLVTKAWLAGHPQPSLPAIPVVTMPAGR
jgi:hypothetical protein